MKNRSKEYFFKYPDFKNLKDLVKYTVENHPDNTSFVIKDKTKDPVEFNKITVKEFYNDINAFGTALYDLGLQDKKVAIISKNRYEWALSYLAVLLGNMVVIPLDKGLKAGEIENSISRVEPDAIIFDNDMEETLANVISDKKIKYHICMDENDKFLTIKSLIKKGNELINNNYKDYLNCEIDDEKASVLCFTSGTSAKSKIVMLSHKNIATNVCALHAVEDFRDTDTNLAVLPFHHTFGSTGFLFIFSYGAATAFPDGLRYIAQNLKEYKISVFIGVPLLIESMYKKIMKEVEKQGKTKLINTARKVTNIAPFTKRKVFKQIIDQLGGNLRLIISGASGIDKDVWKAFNEMGIKILQGYGLTETSPVVAAENCKYSRQGSIGFPMKDVTVKVFDKNEFGIGELAVKGPNVMLGYYQDEEATKGTFRDGWLLTGDLAYIDKDGYIYITGRKKNVIVLKNGKNVYPEELEEIINKESLVKESMVFGMPKDDDLLVSVKVQYDEEYIKEHYSGIDEKEIEKLIWERIKDINKEMPTYKYIKHMVLTNEDFIKTTTAKIKRYEEMKKMKLA